MLETRNLRLTSQESKNMDVKNEKMPTSISDSPNMEKFSFLIVQTGMIGQKSCF